MADTRIDWDLFGERVPAGTRVRRLDDNGRVIWEGILLESYPYAKEELIEYVRPDFAIEWAQELIDDPQLKCQGFHQEVTVPMWLRMPVQFLIDGEWLHTDEIMAKEDGK